jgi:hypothetical protein
LVSWGFSFKILLGRHHGGSSRFGGSDPVKKTKQRVELKSTNREEQCQKVKLKKQTSLFHFFISFLLNNKAGC